MIFGDVAQIPGDSISFKLLTLYVYGYDVYNNCTVSNSTISNFKPLRISADARLKQVKRL